MGQAAIPLAILGSGAIGGGASMMGSKAQAEASEQAIKAQERAAGRIYQPKYSSDIDRLIYGLLQQQAGYQLPMGQYDPIIGSMLGSYMTNILGQPYTYQGAGQQVPNPKYKKPLNFSAWQARAYPSNPVTNRPDRLAQRQQEYNDYLASLPPQYITQPGQEYTYTPSEYAPGGFEDYLHKYLTGAFEPMEGVYGYYADKLRQQIGSQVSAAGLGTSPYGAGVVGEGLTAYTMAMAQDEEARQARALQNYLAGIGGMQGIGAGALQAALGLEAAGQQPTQTAINSLLNYLGLGTQAGTAQAGVLAGTVPYIYQQGQIAAQPWAQAAQGVGGLGSDYMNYLMLQNILQPQTTQQPSFYSPQSFLTGSPGMQGLWSGY